MAITRTPMIDDDGSGTTGTILNNAWKQELYNQIDANPAIVPYVPTWGGTGAAPTLGDGQLTGTYVQLGELVILTVTLIIGSTSTLGAGVWFFSLPPLGPSPAHYVLSAEIFDSATGSSPGIATPVGDGVLVFYASGAPNGVGPSLPFAFKAQDRLTASGILLYP